MWRRRLLPGEFVPVLIVPRTSSRTPSTESTGLVSWPCSGACCSVVLVSLEDVQGEPTVMMPRGCARLLRLRRMVNPELHRCRSVLLPGRAGFHIAGCLCSGCSGRCSYKVGLEF